MKYELTSNGNDFLSLTADAEMKIDARIYSTMSHNPSVLVPGMRDQSATNTINYDTLGSVPLLEELKQTVYDRQSLYQFVMGMINSLESIFSLGIAESQILFDCSYMFVSLYDKSIRFICLPFSSEDIEDTGDPAGIFRTIALNVKSEGAYELIGYMMEQASMPGFAIEKFKDGFEAVYSGGAKDKPKAAEAPNTVNAAPVMQPDFFAPENLNSSAVGIAETNLLGMEYVPAGIPFACSGGDGVPDTIEPNDKTQMMFSGAQEGNDIPYLSPVENNTVEARVYIAGERLTIGRSPENDLHINVNTVSGKHAEIHRTEGSCTIVDLNSTNKTYVNGEALKPQVPVRLENNDLVAFNKVRYRFFC